MKAITRRSPLRGTNPHTVGPSMLAHETHSQAPREVRKIERVEIRARPRRPHPHRLAPHVPSVFGLGWRLGVRGSLLLERLGRIENPAIPAKSRTSAAPFP